MDSLLEKYKNKKPQIVFEWNDTETDAQGWVVINSLRGGAAGGGTRMRLGLDKGEVESLAKVMEIKFTVSGPAIGGAKSGINFDPNDPRKNEVMQRWFKAVSPLLKNYYGTGGDLNIDEIHDVIPITEDLGIWHPQEGIVNGHFQPKDNQKIHLIGQLRTGVSKKVEDSKYTPDINKKYVVADLITGYGVAEAVKHYYAIYKKIDLQNKKAIIQGFGNVAGTAAYYLSKMGVKIVGIIDRQGGLINEEGYSYEEVKALLLNRKNNQITAPNILSFEEVNEKIWKIKSAIFIPAAASKLVTLEQIDSLMANGLEVVSSGANVPFRDSDIFFGDVAKHVDSKIALIPDFIANCGMARTFAYLMSDKIEISDEAIFNDISNTIGKALENCYAKNTSSTGISKTALSIALQQLV
ncbi:MAG: Glu/Leu/Phe/Val dehydrogenase dimerization domain-containing protein [Bacteroidota bacterium]